MTVPEDLTGLVAIDSLALAPGGDRLAVSARTIDLAADSYRDELLVYEREDRSWTRRNVPRLIGTGATWSPSGETLAFVQKARPGANRLVLFSAVTRTVRTLLRWPGTLGGLSWSPNGRRLGFVARQHRRPVGVVLADRAAPPRVIRHLQYRADTIGWQSDRPRHCFAVDVDADLAGEPVNLSGESFDDSDLVWLGTGTEFAFISRRHPGAEWDLVSDIFVGSTDGASSVRALTRSDRQWAALVHDGEQECLYARYALVRELPCNEHLARVHLGSGEVTPLAAGTDRSMDGPLRLRGAATTAPELLSLMVSEGRVDLVGVGVGPGEPAATASALVQRDHWVKAFDAAGGTVVCAAEQGARPPEVYEVVGGSMEALTSFHDGFVVETGSREPDYVGAVAEDGTGIDCWVLRPPEDVELIGAVLYVPGGMAQWGWDYNHDMQVLASAGIAVIFGNARGSGGYSEAWARAICGPHSRYPSTGWCGVDATDMLSIVSAVLAAVPAIDRGRVAVMGGSYGGLMAAYLGFTTDVFAAVIAERGPFNLTAMAATSDEGMWLFEGCIGGTALEEPEQYAASSVMSYVEGAHTPVLIIHSEDDLRCPVQQAEELFTALRRADQDVTFVRFPGESHELSRSGGPVHRVQRAQIIRDWLVARLTGGVAAFEMEG